MSHEELSWLAFRYVAGELTGGENTSFEAHLADDQAAREAVAEAVALYETVALASAQPASITRWQTLRRAVAWVAAAAAVLLVASALFWMSGTDQQPDPNLAQENKNAEPQTSQNGAELATAWTEVRHSQGREPDDVGIREPMESIANPSVGTDEPAGPAIPQWLLTAVAAETKFKE